MLYCLANMEFFHIWSHVKCIGMVSHSYFIGMNNLHMTLTTHQYFCVEYTEKKCILYFHPKKKKNFFSKYFLIEKIGVIGKGEMLM